MTAETMVALLSTIRELHARMPAYDWRHLAQVVENARPDLLCVEMDKYDWETGDFASAPVEDIEALIPLSRRTEITLVPIGGGGRVWSESGVAAPQRGALSALRLQAFRLLDRLTVALIRLARGPRGVNSTLVEHCCAVLCEAQALVADADAKRAWQTMNAELLDGVLWTAKRDPGRRVVVAVDCRRKHWLRRRLSSVADIVLVDYWRL